MNRRLNQKVAVITGASRGIGKAIAEALAAEGATVILTARDRAALDRVAKSIEKQGGQAGIIPSEMTDENSLKQLIATVKKQFSRLDILVNNAGITHSALLEETSAEDYDRCMQVNARGPFILCRESIPLLRNAKPGYIINIASVVGVKGYPKQSAYTASKHAMRGMSMALAEELRAEDIRVHVLCPGGVDTEMIGRVRPDIDKSALIAPQEIAELVVYLVTHRGNAMIDELHIRRASSTPWF